MTVGSPRLFGVPYHTLASRTHYVPARPDPARYRGHLPFRPFAAPVLTAPYVVNPGCTA